MRTFDTVFLDRDGVINRKMEEGDYVKCWEEFSFLPGSVEAVRTLNAAGLRVIVVTNQRGIALGAMSIVDIESIHHRMRTSLEESGASVDAIYYCPHEKESCDCRKPQSGMLLQAQSDFPGLEFTRSYVIGDSLADLEAGTRLGCRTMLIAEGLNREQLLADARALELPVHLVAPTLLEGVQALLAHG